MQAMTDPVVDDFDRGQPEDRDYTDPGQRLRLELNDRDNAVRLKAVLGDQMVYTPGLGWLVWNGRYYDPEGGQDAALAKAAILGDLIKAEAAASSSMPVAKGQIEALMADEGLTEAEAERKIRAGRRAGRARYAIGCGNASRLKSGLEMARSLFRVSAHDLDANRDLLQIANGTLDLAAIAEPAPDAEEPEERVARWRSCLSVPHRRDFLPTRSTGCAFDPEATAPGFARFIELIMPKPADRFYLQRCMGMLLGGQRSEVAFVLLGQGGNGKSTLVKAMEGVLGGYCQPCRIEMFCEQRGVHSGPTPEEAVLPGAWVYSASEPDTHVTLSAAKMKGLTGGDSRQANPKNKDVFSYIPVGIPILQSNKMPNVNDPSEGFWRRIFPIIFGEDLTRLPEDQRMDSEAVARMLEEERAGILNWMVEGWIAYRDIGLHPPAPVRELKGQLRALADPVGQFLAERCVRGLGYKARTSAIRLAFNHWCEDEGHKPLGAKAFTSQLLARDLVRRKVGGYDHWIGIDLGTGTGPEGDGAEL